MEELEKIYYINVGKGGTFKPSEHQKYDTTAKDVDILFDYLKTNNQKKLVVYFHGGLVGDATGMNTASRIKHHVKEKTSSHPVAFVWETGPVETILQNLDTIKQSAFFKKLLIKILKVAGRKMGIDVKDFLGASKGVGNLTDQEINIELQKEAPFENYEVDAGKKSAAVQFAELTPENDTAVDTALENEVAGDMEEEIHADQELIGLAAEEKPDAEAKLMQPNNAANNVQPDAVREKGIISAAALIYAAIKITVKVIKRHIQNRDHGFFPTIVEEIFREYYIADIGSWGWRKMQNKASAMWEKDDFSGNEESWHAGTYFLKKLNQYQDEAGTLTIDLIGHSAGSIAICEMVKAAKERYSSIKFRNIIFMAPAVRCDQFNECLLKNQDYFTGFRYFTMKDEVEKKDWLLSFIYPRSLLYFISGLLENKGKDFDAYILGLQRHTVGNKPYHGGELKPIVDYLKVPKRAIYSVTDLPGEDGFRSNATRHGWFDDDNKERDGQTLVSIMHFINQ